MKDKTKIAVFIVVLLIVSVAGFAIYKNQSSKPGATSTTTSVKNGGLGSALSGIGAFFGL